MRDDDVVSSSATTLPVSALRAFDRIVIRALERRYPGTRWVASEVDASDLVAAGLLLRARAEDTTGETGGDLAITDAPDLEP